jgi:O-methyltransferase
MRVIRALRYYAATSLTTAFWLLRGLWLHRKYREFTMVHPAKYAGNLVIAARGRKTPGVVVECGVWRGGMIAGLAEVMGRDREYHLFDSFEGLPPAQEIDGPGAIAYQQDKTSAAYYDNCRAEMAFAEKAMARSGARNVIMHQGWFSDTVPDFRPEGGIALLRLDGDWYESTIECLRALYPRVVPGGVILIDDYHAWDGCARAVHEYLAESGTTDRLREDFAVTYIVKDAWIPGWLRKSEAKADSTVTRQT